MSMHEYTQKLEPNLHAEAAKHGFAVRRARLTDFEGLWEILQCTTVLAVLKTNGEVFDLVISSDWHFYAFEYDSSMEIVAQLFAVLAEYTQGRYVIRRTMMGKSAMLIETAGVQWEARRTHK